MIHNKTLLSLLFFLFSFSSFSQKAPISLYKQSEIVITDFEDGVVVKDLLHPDVSYKGSETFELFGPHYVIEDAVEWYWPEKVNEGNDTLNDVQGATVTVSSKIRIKISPDQLEIGEYYIKVKNADGDKIHTRSFEVVNPLPNIEYINVETVYDDKTYVRKDTLFVARNQSFDETKIRLKGEYISQRMESVSIQDMALFQNESDVNTFQFDDEWMSEKLNEIELGNSSLVVKRKYASLPATAPIFITAPKPVILGESLVFFVEEGQSKIDISLSVNNLFKDAKIKLKADSKHPDFIQNQGLKVATDIDLKEGKISFPVVFKPMNGSGAGAFKVMIINADNNESSYKTINLIKKNKNLRISPLEARKPIVAGIENNIRIDHLEGTLLNENKSNEFTLIFENTDPIVFTGNNITEKSLTATVRFPENISSDIVKFTLKNGDNEWDGEMNAIIKKPKVKVKSFDVYNGSTVKVQVENAKNVVLLPAETGDNIAISQPNNNERKEFEISIKNGADDFWVHVKLHDHITEKLYFKTKNYPNPEFITAHNSVDNSLIRNGMIVIDDETNSLKLQIKINQNITEDATFYAQIYKKNGSALGSKREFIKSKDGKKLITYINTQIGLDSGDEFDIIISNPNGDSKALKAYIKRNKNERFMITGGLSAIDYRFNAVSINDGEDEKKALVLDGVNIGMYYMFENYSNPSFQYLGVGANILLASDDNDISLRTGVTVLLLEKLVLGLTFGKGGAGILAGVNIELADLSVLLGK